MSYTDPLAVADIVSLAGKKVVGRTKLQKSACGLKLAGVGFSFEFSYSYYGPYSEDLRFACDDANALGLIVERRRRAEWGGEYSEFTTSLEPRESSSAIRHTRQELLSKMNATDSITLELAITAAFLAMKGVLDPWAEVTERKPDKAISSALRKAKRFYKDLLTVRTPRLLPTI